MTGTSPSFLGREQAKAYVSQAIVGLATAGTALGLARDGTPADGQELIDALRDDIKNMIGDVEALRSVIHQG